MGVKEVLFFFLPASAGGLATQALSLSYPPQKSSKDDFCCPQRGHGHFRFAAMLMPISLSYPPKKSSNDDFFCPQRGHGHFRFAAMLMPISLSYPPKKSSNDDFFCPQRGLTP